MNNHLSSSDPGGQSPSLTVSSSHGQNSSSSSSSSCDLSCVKYVIVSYFHKVGNNPLNVDSLKEELVKTLLEEAVRKMIGDAAKRVTGFLDLAQNINTLSSLCQIEIVYAYKCTKKGDGEWKIKSKQLVPDNTRDWWGVHEIDSAKSEIVRERQRIIEKIAKECGCGK